MSYGPDFDDNYHRASGYVDRKHPARTAGGSGQAASLVAFGLPVPWQKLIKVLDGVIGNAGEHVGEPSLRVDVVEFRRHDQRGPWRQRGRPPSSEPAKSHDFLSESNAAQGALGGVVRSGRCGHRRGSG